MDVEKANQWLDFLERITASRFAVLIVLMMAVAYLVWRAMRQDKAIKAKDEIIVVMTQETTQAMSESTSALNRLADGLKGLKS